MCYSICRYFDTSDMNSVHLRNNCVPTCLQRVNKLVQNTFTNTTKLRCYSYYNKMSKSTYYFFYSRLPVVYREIISRNGSANYYYIVVYNHYDVKIILFFILYQIRNILLWFMLKLQNQLYILLSIYESKDKRLTAAAK